MNDAATRNEPPTDQPAQDAPPPPRRMPRRLSKRQKQFFRLLGPVGYSTLAFAMLGRILFGFIGWGVFIYVILGPFFTACVVSVMRELRKDPYVVSTWTMTTQAGAWLALVVAGLFLIDANDVVEGSIATAVSGIGIGTSMSIGLGALIAAFVMLAATSLSRALDVRRAKRKADNASGG